MMSDQALREAVCDIGRRIYQRGFAAANDGNISVRLSERQILCTPTMHCKGFLTPDDLCIVDPDGKHLAGRARPSSEILLHLEILAARADVRAVVHCHPPHATAFAVAREPIPQGILPEVEMFLGEVPIAPYETPGSRALAESVRPFLQSTNVVVLANHGTVSYGESLERAYWWTEILDAYCRVLILARQLGGVNYLPRDKVLELLELKVTWGFRDPRLDEELAGCDPLAHAAFRDTWQAAGLSQRAFPPPEEIEPSRQQSADGNNLTPQPPVAPLPTGIDVDALADSIAKRVLDALDRRQD